jgi:hypothetical protein
MSTHRTSTGAAGSGSSPNPDADPVVTWRAQRLMSAGVGPVIAYEVAQVHGFDIHALLDLLDRGCPVNLAVRIIDPFDVPADAS